MELEPLRWWLLWDHKSWQQSTWKHWKHVWKEMNTIYSHETGQTITSPNYMFMHNKLTNRLSAFLMVCLSHLYMTTGKTIVLTVQTFIGKVMSLLFGFVIVFFPRSKCLLISWLQSPSAVILEPKKIKSVTVSTFPLYLPWSKWTREKGIQIIYVK